MSKKTKNLPLKGMITLKYPKQRLEAFSDGVIAIIITIMVLNIPVPNTFDFESIKTLLFTIFVYFLSFIVVGAFWNQHHRILSFIDGVNTKLLVFNLLFLFFLSLIPIFTKWVMFNPGEHTPVIGYALVYLLTVFSYMLMLRIIISESSDEKIIKMREQHAKNRILRKNTDTQNIYGILVWLRFFIATAAIILMVFISIAFPKTSTIFLLGLPVLSSIVNLFFDNYRRKKHKNHE